MKRYILGIAAFYHDSSATLLLNGEVLAAAQEERFSRIKHDSDFPAKSIAFVLEFAGITIDDVEVVAFYEKPLLKFERLLETYHSFAPVGLKSFLKAMPVWIKEKLLMKRKIREELKDFGSKVPEIIFPEHHLSHAASAFYPSGFSKAAILTIDAVGEWATTTISEGDGKNITIIKQLDFPHSLGLLYSAFTYYCGFKVNSGEYKLMGLAPFGDEDSPRTQNYRELIEKNLISMKEDGSLFLNMKYFDFAAGLKMCRDKDWEALFGLPARVAEGEIDQTYMDLALACQQVTEEIVLRLARTARAITGHSHLVMAGGVALNCVANGKILEEGIFDQVWVQPAAGDAGGSLGAALACWHIYLDQENTIHDGDRMKGSALGPEFSSVAIERTIRKYSGSAQRYDDTQELDQTICHALSKGEVVGWFQGRMEFGPRALGHRSILASATDPMMQKKLNLKIKHREGFRPFAPAVLEEDCHAFFELAQSSPYMLFVAPLKKGICLDRPDNWSSLAPLDKLYCPRSSLPAITHIDNSARVQTVCKERRPRFWQLLNKYKEVTGAGVLVNTSFNVRGEPIVCSPDDAYRCFMRTELDILVLENFIFYKSDQPKFLDTSNWKDEFKLD